MRRWLTIIAVVLSLVIGTNAGAITTQKKTAGQSSTAATTAPKAKDSTAAKAPPASSDKSDRRSLLDKLKREVQEAKKDKPAYDHYIDRNNDGVDDRVAARKRTISTSSSDTTKHRRGASRTSTKQKPPR